MDRSGRKVKHLPHSSLQFSFLKCFYFFVFTFGNRRGEKQFSANGLNLFSISKPCLPLEHSDARPPISSRNTTEVVMGPQLLVRHGAHSSPPCSASRVCSLCQGFLNEVCPVPKGFSTSCDQSAVEVQHLEPTSLAVWFGIHLSVSVCVCALKHILCVCVYKPLCCIAAVWERERIQAEDAPSFVPCIHTKCP